MPVSDTREIMLRLNDDELLDRFEAHEKRVAEMVGEDVTPVSVARGLIRKGLDAAEEDSVEKSGDSTGN